MFNLKEKLIFCQEVYIVMPKINRIRDFTDKRKIFISYKCGYFRLWII
jgi:hypothetical protein